MLEPDDRPRGRVELTRNMGIGWSDHDTAWIVERDEYDVQRLIRARIRDP